MYPEIILHNAMSLDGRITNFPADLELFYSLAATWNPDAILFGSSTILEAPFLDVPPEHEELFQPPPGTTADPRPLMVVIDSKGKIRCWDILKKWPYFRGFIAICSKDTPLEYREYLAEKSVDMIVSGSEKVDFKAARVQIVVELSIVLS